MSNMIAFPAIAPAHEPYLIRSGQAAEAVSRLADVVPLVVESSRPLLHITPRSPDKRLSIMPFQRPDTGRYMNIVTDTQVALAEPIVSALARKVEANRRHFPREPTLADTFGVPGLYLRLDCILTPVDDEPSDDPEHALDPHGGRSWRRVAIAICEFDDQPAFVGSFCAAGHASAYRQFDRLSGDLAALGRPLHLADFTLDPAYHTHDTYPHDDGIWLTRAGDDAEVGAVAVIARARRSVPGSRRFLDRWTSASIFPGGRFRDYKGVLGIPRSVDRDLGLGVLVSDHSVARDVIMCAHREGLGPIMAKAVFSARREAAMAIAPGSRSAPSYYRLNQLARLEHGHEQGRPYRQSLVLQPAFRPATFADLGIRLNDQDARAVVAHRYRTRLGKWVTGDQIFRHLPCSGNERRFYALFRLYFVYLPSENRTESKTVRFAGGLLQGCTTPMSIHGSNGTLTVWVDASV